MTQSDIQNIIREISTGILASMILAGILYMAVKGDTNNTGFTALVGLAGGATSFYFTRLGVAQGQNGTNQARQDAAQIAYNAMQSVKTEEAKK